MSDLKELEHALMFTEFSDTERFPLYSEEKLEDICFRLDLMRIRIQRALELKRAKWDPQQIASTNRTFMLAESNLLCQWANAKSSRPIHRV